MKTEGLKIEPAGNLAALLTPPGKSAIAVIRLSGPLVKPFLQTCFSRPAIPSRCVHGELRDGEKIIDDPVVVLSPDGNSVEINVHGGMWVVESSLELARRKGFVLHDCLAAPLPDFLIDAADEIEREMLAFLPLAITELALRVLLAQPQAWKKFEQNPPSRAQARLMLDDRSLHWLLNPPRVAIVGIPNAGKSTLANQLFGSQRSITADLPGTTRDWVGETANLGGLAVTLIDTPGIRSTNDSIEAQAIERAAAQIRSADAIVLVLDATRLQDTSQQSLILQFPDAIRVLNKSDIASIESSDAGIQILATIGKGISNLEADIRRRFDCEVIDPERACCWTEKQRQTIRTIAECPDT